jgi:Tfp pilus assembly protein PilF
MIRKYIRLIIASLILIASVLLFFKGFIFIGILVVLVSVFVTLSHFRNENIILAFYFIKKNNIPSAMNAVSRIKHPEYLIKSQEAYYYLLTGMLESQQHNISKAEKSFKKALSVGLRMDSDQAVAKLNLAGIYLAQRNKKLAQHYLQDAKKLDKQKMLKAQIREVEEMMKRV